MFLTPCLKKHAFYLGPQPTSKRGRSCRRPTQRFMKNNEIQSVYKLFGPGNPLGGHFRMHFYESKSTSPSPRFRERPLSDPVDEQKQPFLLCFTGRREGGPPELPRSKKAYCFSSIGSAQAPPREREKGNVHFYS